MFIHKYTTIALLIALFFLPQPTTQAEQYEKPQLAKDHQNLTDVLEKIRIKHNLPSLAAACIKDGQIVASGTTGFRAVTSKTPVTINDKYHLGSCTKSMTALLAAIYVHEKKLAYDTTLEQYFKDRNLQIHPKYKQATLEQLLTHRAGVPKKLNMDNLWSQLWKNKTRLAPVKQREMLLHGVLKHPPLFNPGEGYHYSNAGYTIAGIMIERSAKKPWEKELTDRVFKPLGLTSAGFGMPGKPGKLDQPLGHRRIAGQIVPVPKGPQDDNPPAIGPGGTVHMNIHDFARYAHAQILGHNHGALGLPKEAFIKMHTAVKDKEGKGDYGHGWGVYPRGWAAGNALSHTGSNTKNYAVMWLAPKKNFAVVVATNIWGDPASLGCDEVAGYAIRNMLNAK